MEKWTKEDLDYIKNNWGKVTIKEMARKFQVSTYIIKSRADSMNLPSLKITRSKRTKWTKNKIKKLRQLAKELTPTEIANYFQISRDALNNIARKNKIVLKDERIKWTEQELNDLEEYAKTYNIEQISVKMHKSINAIQRRADYMHLNIKPVNDVWTNEDDDKLKDLIAENKSLFAIVKIMNKNDRVILEHAKKMGMSINVNNRPWTDDEKNKLRELSKTTDLDEIALLLNRTSYSVKSAARTLEIKLSVKRKNWTPEETLQLQQYLNEKKTPSEIASLLDRTETAIVKKIYKLGLKIPDENKRPWTKEDYIILKDLWGNKKIEDISKELNRSISSIKHKVFQLHLGAQMANNYMGLSIKELSEILNVNEWIITNSWAKLGLNIKTHAITNYTAYKYVMIDDLFYFLERHQDIWDSNNLEKNILGEEPEWLSQKRIADQGKVLSLKK